MFSGAKILTMYEVKGRVLGLGIVIAVVIFIIIMSGYNRSASADSQIKPGFIQWSSVDQKDFQFKATSDNITENIYAIVFDAGSTGSRIHILQFKSKAKGKSLVLVKEIFDRVKPGLSSYGHDPVEGAESLRKMLNLALSVVPSHLQHDTPITLKATAGLRLLPEKNATEILKCVRRLFREYHFLVPDNAVSIMDGVDEGVLSWMTVNFLLGHLKTNTKTVAALDLGGGSTQITFNPTEQSTFSSVPKDYIRTVHLFKKQHVLYTHSYLGLGLKAARFSILGGSRKGKSRELSSVCLPSGHKGHWKYDGLVRNISGDSSLKSEFALCWAKAEQLVKSFLTNKVDELRKNELYLFSYFYDRAVDAGILDKNDGGKLAVGDFERAARNVFKAPRPEKPFLAMDLTYIYSLLHDGYHLDPSDSIVLKKKINDVELSWAVGAAFQLLSSTGKAR